MSASEFSTILINQQIDELFKVHSLMSQIRYYNYDFLGWSINLLDYRNLWYLSSLSVILYAVKQRCFL
ncbi:hypothetical protein CANARDRAFT_26800 [[Candida] arabinofermentans NRRL YB-2248]|uniref:Uncharacterized protein n=1 Tax=[Candida] arabinofermentans NRRL YB-2248 TaxID=983967 RepID=A0A1E4T6L3_9ASCO|nr:hypothetical protein CANARDRAFT_26800 [[Candida] arabinofermentans NRRL YB-2248]